MKFLDTLLTEKERRQAQIEASIMSHTPYKEVYDNYVGNRLPSEAAISDYVKTIITDLENSEASTIAEVFLANASHLKLVGSISGSERLLSIEHAIESLKGPMSGQNSIVRHDTTTKNVAETEEVCFYVAPIGAEGSEFRKHSDLFFAHIVQPALEEFNIKLVRSDMITEAGTISKQIIKHLLTAKLVVADLSFHNPNVFYELAIRHASRLPTVQIIRAVDPIPFDVSGQRTIIIDDSDIYTLIPSLDRYRSLISAQVRAVLEDPDSVDNPLLTVFPKLSMSL